MVVLVFLIREIPKYSRNINTYDEYKQNESCSIEICSRYIFILFYIRTLTLIFYIEHLLSALFLFHSCNPFKAIMGVVQRGCCAFVASWLLRSHYVLFVRCCRHRQHQQRHNNVDVDMLCVVRRPSLYSDCIIAQRQQQRQKHSLGPPLGPSLGP